METLALLFGSPAKVRIMRLFLFNPTAHFDFGEVGDRAQAYPSDVRRELFAMERMRLVKRKTISRTSEVKIKDKKGRVSKRMRTKKIIVFALNEKFPFLDELLALLTNTVPLKSGEMMKKLNLVGRIKLVIVSGVFIGNPDSRVDLLVVADSIRKSTLENTVKFIESEMGKELRYAAFETGDFLYRRSVYDKLIKDILDYPHHVIINKLGI